jgi:VanZ family protein
MSSRYKTAFRFLPPLLWVAIIVFLSLVPADDLPETPLFNIPHFDKLVHAGLYFILAILLVRPLQKVKLPAYLYAIVFSVLLGGGLELLQLYCTGTRTGSWFDLLADMLGTAGGLVLCHLTVKRELST